MLGIIPAAGAGTRIQPLAFSKELLPVGTRITDDGERPRAISEYLLERMALAGVTRVCFVISPEKADIMRYFGSSVDGIPICYVVQQRPAGLCDAIFCAAPFVEPREHVVVGLPDTVWFPRHGLRQLPDGHLSFLLFPVDHPEHFDAVVTDGESQVREIQVKTTSAASSWVWGAFKMPVPVFAELHELWQRRGRRDQFIGHLVNAYLHAGGRARGICAGTSYIDVGTLGGYREAVRVLHGTERGEPLSISHQESHEAAK